MKIEIHPNSTEECVGASGKTHNVQINKTSRIKLYGEIAAITCKNVKKHMKAVCDEEAEASHVKSRDIGLCSGYYRALKALVNYTLLNMFHIQCINLQKVYQKPTKCT